MPCRKAHSFIVLRSQEIAGSVPTRQIKLFMRHILNFIEVLWGHTLRDSFPAEWRQPMAMVQRDKGIYTLSVLGICRCWSKAQESDLQASKRDSD